MSCIVAIRHADGVSLGADSMFAADHVMQRGTPKLWSVNEHVAVGTVGTCRFGNIVQLVEWPGFDGLGPEKILEKLVREVVPQIERFKYDEKSGWGIIAVGRELFMLGSDLSVVHPTNLYTALGSSEDVALGALWMSARVGGLSCQERLVAALEASQEHTNTVRGPWVFAETRSLS